MGYKQAQLGVIVIDDDEDEQSSYTCRFIRPSATASQEEKEHGAADAAGIVAHMVASQAELMLGAAAPVETIQSVFAAVVQALHADSQMDGDEVKRLFDDRQEQENVAPPAPEEATDTV